MKRINLCAKICAIALAASMIFSLSACLPKPSDEVGGKENTPVVDDFAPAIDNGESSKLGKEYKNHFDIASFELGFLTHDSECFEYEETEDGVKITKYKGEYEVFAVPDSIDGKAVVAIGREAFAANRWLTAIILPDSINSVESLAFYGCSNLCYVDLGAGKKKLENYAFASCPSLYGMDLTSCVSVGVGSFFGCNSINFVKMAFVGGTRDENNYLGYIFGAESPEHNGEMVPDSLRKIVLADTCTYIPDLAFANCKYITSVIIPDSVESIGVRAFYRCRSLTEIDTGDGVKAISDDAFFGCDNLRSVKLGDAVESIGMQAFFGCRSLESINADGVASIGSYAFYGTPITQEENGSEE